MKTNLVLLILSLFLLPAFAGEEDNITDGEKEPQADEEIVEENNVTNVKKYNHLRNAAQISPKKMHIKILKKAQNDFIKDKKTFEKLKEKELWLLNNESVILDYSL